MCSYLPDERLNKYSFRSSSPRETQTESLFSSLNPYIQKEGDGLIGIDRTIVYYGTMQPWKPRSFINSPQNAAVPNAMLIKDRSSQNVQLKYGQAPSIGTSSNPHAVESPAALHFHVSGPLHLLRVLEKPPLCFII